MEKTHQAYSCIAPEKNISNDWLTFNFNPKDPVIWQDHNRLTDPFGCWLNCYYKVMDKIKHARIICRVELSGTGRPHFHGIIKIFDIPEFYLYSLPLLKLHGVFEIDTIENQMTWDIYCRKGQEIWGPYLA